MSYDRSRARYQVPLVAVGLGAGIAALAVAALLRKRFRKPFDEQAWADSLDDLARIKSPLALLREVSEQGLQHSLRKEVWPFLVGVLPFTSTAHDRDVMLKEMTSAYNNLLQQCQEMERALAEAVALANNSPPPSASHHGAPDDHPVVPPEVVQFGEAHQIIILDALRTDFKHRAYPQPSTPESAAQPPAQHPSAPPNPVKAALEGARAMVNVWFNGHLMPDTLAAQPAAAHGAPPGGRDPADAAQGLDGLGGGVQQVWCSRAAKEALLGAGHLDAYRRLQAKRLVALLSAYAVYDPYTGYCQGMSDLAAPFLVLMEDDALAFWCFASLMARVRGNFAADDALMCAQLRALGEVLQAADPPLHHRLMALGASECHFAYRMVVVLMRRELSMDRAMQLWEMIWAEAALLRLEQAASGAAAVAPPLPAGGAAGHFAQSPWVTAPSCTESGPGTSSSVVLAGEWAMFLYLAAAVVVQRRRQVLDDCPDHDAVLQLFTSVRFSAHAALAKAREMRRQLQEKLAPQAHPSHPAEGPHALQFTPAGPGATSASQDTPCEAPARAAGPAEPGSGKAAPLELPQQQLQQPESPLRAEEALPKAGADIPAKQ